MRYFIPILALLFQSFAFADLPRCIHSDDTETDGLGINPYSGVAIVPSYSKTDFTLWDFRTGKLIGSRLLFPEGPSNPVRVVGFLDADTVVFSRDVSPWRSLVRYHMKSQKSEVIWQGDGVVEYNLHDNFAFWGEGQYPFYWHALDLNKGTDVPLLPGDDAGARSRNVFANDGKSLYGISPYELTMSSDTQPRAYQIFRWPQPAFTQAEMVAEFTQAEIGLGKENPDLLVSSIDISQDDLALAFASENEFENPLNKIHWLDIDSKNKFSCNITPPKNGWVTVRVLDSRKKTVLVYAQDTNFSTATFLDMKTCKQTPLPKLQNMQDFIGGVTFYKGKTIGFNPWGFWDLISGKQLMATCHD